MANIWGIAFGGLNLRVGALNGEAGSISGEIFISYASEDRQRIRPLADTLEARGWSVFWDREIPAGKSWREVLDHALKDARCVLVAWSENSIVSRWVQEEAEDGRDRAILIPVLIDNVRPPLGFRSVQAADLSAWDHTKPSEVFEGLLANIDALLGPFHREADQAAPIRQHLIGERQPRDELDAAPAQETTDLPEKIPTEHTVADSGKAMPASHPMRPERPSIAVLPFTNLSGDPEQDFFGDGLAEDIITELSRFRSLFVIARNSSFTYKGHAVDAKTVARDLGVRYVLEGSVRKSDQRIRVTSQLIEAETGNHIWAERYDRELGDLFAIQDELTNAIVATIEPEIGAAERARALRKAPETLDAWGLYQKGLTAYYSATEEGFQTAIDLFDRVNAMDPNFALAFAMAAETRCAFIGIWNPDQKEALLTEAAEKARRAIALAPRESMCLVPDVRVCILQGQFDLAIAKARQAVALNPNNALAHWMLGIALTRVQKAQEALENLDQAIRLNPNSVFTNSFHVMRAAALFQLERYEEAVESAQRGVHAAPRPLPFGILVASLSQLDRMNEAKVVLEQLYKHQPDFRVRITLSRYMGPRLAEALRKAGIPE